MQVSKVVREHKLASLVLAVMLVSLFVGGAQHFAVGLVPAPWDKLAHAAFFLVFAFVMLRYMQLPIVWVIALAMLVGVTDEIHQLFLPGRTAGWDDCLADVVGAVLAVMLFRSKSKERRAAASLPQK